MSQGPGVPAPRGGGDGGSNTPKWLYGTMGFVSAGGFLLGIRQGKPSRQAHIWGKGNIPPPVLGLFAYPT